MNFEELSKVAEQAYLRAESRKELNIEGLTKQLIEALTLPCKDEKCNAEGLVKVLERSLISASFQVS